tara:strand:- start:704 stop:2473 length:1770 start_codon:yes stop_codon:yes gene_type:complete
MSHVVAALDSHTSTVVGENGHLQYGWSNDFKESLLQFSFQLTRTSKEHCRNSLANKFRDILSRLNLNDKHDSDYVLSLIVKMIAHTRDIVSGKGEYELTYMMIYELHKYYPELAEQLFIEITKSSTNEQPLGSWKDFKYLANYIKTYEGENHVFIQFMINETLKQLNKDLSQFISQKWAEEHNSKISLLARWIPREKSQFGWLFKRLAEQFFNKYIVSAKENSIESAKKKCYTKFRKKINEMNKYLCTTQIYQCNGNWREIDINKVTSITMNKQNNALRNIDKKGNMRSDNEDRIKCANNFKEYLNNVAKGKTTLKGKCVSMIDFVKTAINLNSQSKCGKFDDLDGKRTLNYQWNDNAKYTEKLKSMIAMVDTSGSMSCDNCIPLYSAIGLGCRIAEKSSIGKRVLTFSSNPSWVNLESCNTFTDMVEKISKCEWGFSTNFSAALKLILDAVVEQKLRHEIVKDMTLVILSDMQIDSNGNENIDDSMMAFINRMYYEAGMKLFNEPYTPPHIIFWNLRSTSGFPCLSSHKGCSMMSGTSPQLLNLFCEKGPEVLEKCTPWNLFIESLENERYKNIGDFCDKFIIENNNI